MKRLPTWVEIDLDRLSLNLEAIRERVGAKTGVLLTVKADAYGHGAVQVAEAAASLVDMFGVATLDEAIELRDAGVACPLLILSPVLEQELSAVVESGFAITLSSFEMAQSASQSAIAGQTRLDVHVEVDTGMGRTGVSARIAALPGITLSGVYTHFPVSDTDAEFTRGQIDSLGAIVAGLRAAGVAIPTVHSANSAAVSALRESHMNLVRPGLLAFGLHPIERVADTGLHVHPIMSWKSRLVAVRNVPAGSTISYGRDFETPRDSVIGVVPVGYGHGYPFALSDRGEVLVRGRRVPIVGRVTMDMIMVDLTELSQAPCPGDEVVLVGEQNGAVITFHDVAGWAGSICYEIMCGISKRVPRTYFRQGKVETYKSLLGVLPNHLISV
jgi:alanine racemase